MILYIIISFISVKVNNKKIRSSNINVCDMFVRVL